MIKPVINIFSENIYEKWQVDEAKLIEIARNVLKYYMQRADIYENSCLYGQIYDTISFDILYCDGEKTHQINKEYRNKDYPADIITFAIFADDENAFIFDGDINLGEIVIALDGEVLEGAIPGKQLKMLEGWMAIHEDELKANWKMLSEGEGYFKIDPLR